MQSPEVKLKQKERDLITDWLGKVSNTLRKRAMTILQTVIEKLQHPTMRKAMTDRIKEQAGPSVRKILEEYRQNNHQNTKRSNHRSHSMER